MAMLNEAEKEKLINSISLEELEQAIKLKHEREFEINAEIRAKAEERYRDICAAAKAERDGIFSQHPVKRNSNRQVSHINTQQPRSVVRGYRAIPKVIDNIIDVCHEFEKGQSYRDAVKIIARKKGLKSDGTVADACCRRFGDIDTNRFKYLLTNRKLMVQHMIACFPDYEEYILEELKEDETA